MPRTRTDAALLLAALLLGACGGPDGLDDAEAWASDAEELSSATVRFPPMVTWGVLAPPKTSGTIKAGAKLRVYYDRSRIAATCYATLWDRLSYRFRADAAWSSVDLWSNYGNATASPALVVPAGADRFEMYVERIGQNKGQSGMVPCSIRVDSALKRIGARVASGRVVANADWTISNPAPAFRGKPVVFEYRRQLPSACHAGAAPASATSVEYFNGTGTPGTASLATGRATITAPTQAGDRLVFWFHAREGGCDSWDSDYGRNYSVPLYWPL